jgi:hypothetical protein
MIEGLTCFKVDISNYLPSAASSEVI